MPRGRQTKPPPTQGAADDAVLKRAVLAWYMAADARPARDLPWRHTDEPYAIWISETMLQQTRAATVVPYWERFLQELPTVHALAEAPEERVLSLWSGLGYYRRARMLQAAARRIVAEHGGRVPGDPQVLRSLEGVGAYTAGAIASIAFKARAAAVDGNVTRVLTRLFGIEEDVTSALGQSRVWAVAHRLADVDQGDAGDWTQALMELGALVCTPRDPKCRACPVRSHCDGWARGIASELPRKKPKRAPSEVRRVALVFASQRVVVLARRGGKGLMAGLWEPPQAVWRGEEPMSAARGLATQMGFDPRSLAAAGEVVHELTHRRLRVHVLTAPAGRPRTLALPGAEYDAIEFVSRSELAEAGEKAKLHAHTRPHATLTRKILNVAKLAH